jgi:hypothetical protein
VKDSSPRRERGQASVEAVAGIALLAAAGLLAFQLLGAGYAAVMAGHSAEAAALAVANGGDPQRAALDAVPGWPRRALEVRARGGHVRVTLTPPSPLGFLRGRLQVNGEAAALPPR